MLDINLIYHGDCLEIMQQIDDKSIDMILCDLPYGNGITGCQWDCVLDKDLMWQQYERIIKDNGAIVLFSTQPFTTDLIMSNRKLFRYELIWEKSKPSGAVLAKVKPMKAHENILVFGKNKLIYNPQMTERSVDEIKRLSKKSVFTSNTDVIPKQYAYSGNREHNKLKYPNTVLHFKSVFNRSKDKTCHPTQKPVDLCEWLIKTYTNEGNLVLDNCIGSGTTAIACLNTNRDFIGIEKELKYVQIANQRIQTYLRDEIIK